MIDEAYETAYNILIEKKDEWERLAEGLLEYESLTGEQIQRVARGEPPHSDDDDDKSDTGSAPSVTAIPKTKPKAPRGGDGGMEPEPTA